MPRTTSKPEPPPNADNPEQSRRFIDMAREVEVDEDPEAFDRAFGKITTRNEPTARASVPKSPRT